MSYAPDDLLAIRQYVIDATSLGETDVGIVGDDTHDGGYHCGKDRCDSDDYSMRQSSRDGPHATNGASAEDIGRWSGGAGRTGISFLACNQALVDACRRGDPRCEGVREIICTLDGSNVMRWDALGLSSTGDSSHLYHTHLSFFRDSEGRRAGEDNFLGLLREIIDGAQQQMEDDMNNLFVRDSSGRVWLSTGGGIRRLSSESEAVGGAFVDYDLGEAGADGAVCAFGTPPAGMDVWGIDVGGLLGQVLTNQAADKVRDDATKVAIGALTAALTAGTGAVVDSAAILARIDQVAAQESVAINALRTDNAALLAHVAELQAGISERDARLAAAYGERAGK